MIQLEGVEETLLIPLLARARESRRWNGLVRDARAVELVQGLAYDFAKLRLDAATQRSVAVRTALFDEAARTFLAAHPDALVLNLAAGLDTRWNRLENGQLTWVDVDLPDAMTLRRELFPAGPRHQLVTGSVTEDAWLAEVPHHPGQAVLVIAEGLLMYLQPEETRALVQRLADRFPGAELLLEVVSPWAVQQSATYFEQRGLTARWHGGLADAQELEAWDPRLEVVAEYRYYDRFPLRLGLMALGRWIPQLNDFFRIVHVRVAPQGATTSKACPAGSRK